MSAQTVPTTPTLLVRRHELGLGLREAARHLGISPTHLSDVEAGRRTPSDTLIPALASTYGLPEAALRARWGRPSAAVLRMATRDQLTAERLPAVLRAAEALQTPEQWTALEKATGVIAQPTPAARQAALEAEAAALAELTGLSRWFPLLSEILDNPATLTESERIALASEFQRAGAALSEMNPNETPETADQSRERVRETSRSLERQLRSVAGRVANAAPPKPPRRGSARQPKAGKRTKGASRRRRPAKKSDSDEGGGDGEPPPDSILSIERCRELLPNHSDTELATLRRIAVGLAKIAVRTAALPEGDQ